MFEDVISEHQKNMKTSSGLPALCPGQNTKKEFQIFMNIHQATVEVLMDFQSSHEPKGTAFTERYDLVIGNLVGNN